MSLTTSELLKVIDQLKDYVAIAKQRNDIINDDKPYPIEKRIDLLRINNQANDYKKYYDEEGKNIVAKLFEKDIDFFKYNF